MKIKVIYWCEKCEKKDERVIELNPTVRTCIQWFCDKCNSPMTALSAGIAK